MITLGDADSRSLPHPLGSPLNRAARSMRSEPVAYNLTEMRDGYMFSTAMPDGASLLALAGPGCDIGQIGHELAGLINRVGPAPHPPHRNGAALAPSPER